MYDTTYSTYIPAQYNSAHITIENEIVARNYGMVWFGYPEGYHNNGE